MNEDKKLIAMQLIVLILLGFIGYKMVIESDSKLLESGAIEVQDSNGVTHYFDETPDSVVITLSLIHISEPTRL